ncbi:MAG: helix-turn-helix domain-containing protein, partial [Clostridia bacterium]|nr:helix-turn-helix domain-containing protein [Clostridia bacterium]
MDNLPDFAERLTELIFESGKNIKQISEELGCGNSTVYHYTTGRYLPNLDMTVKLADYFHCTTDYLLGVAAESKSDDFKACAPFGEAFTKALKEKGVSRYSLKIKTDVAESVMRYWAQGKTTPSVINLVKIEKA